MERSVPVISTFFGITIRMFFDDHGLPHFHAEFQGDQATFDFSGRLLAGEIRSPTARRLIRKWVRLHRRELEANWDRARNLQPLSQIAPVQ